MDKNRMINPEFWLDEDLAKLTPHARLLYIGLWAICDDNFATFPFRPDWVKAQVFPYEKVDIRKLLRELEEGGKIIGFTADDGRDYCWIKNFFKYQRVEKPSKPKYPEYKPESDDSRGIVGEESVNTPAKVKISKDKISKDNTSVCKSFISSSGKKIELEVAENYVPDGFSPLQAKQARKMMERSLGKKKTNKWASFVFGAGWDFIRAYQNFQGETYVGNVLLEEVAKNLSSWYEQGETRETIQQMIIAFFGSEKAEKVTITPNSVFSTHTYNSWKQGKLIQKNKQKKWL